MAQPMDYSEEFEDEWEEEEEPSHEKRARWALYEKREAERRARQEADAERRRRKMPDVDFLADFEEEDGEEEDEEDTPPVPQLDLNPPPQRALYSYPMTHSIFRRYFDTVVEQGNPAQWVVEEIYGGDGGQLAVSANVPDIAFNAMKTHISITDVQGTTYVTLFFNLPFSYAVKKTTASGQKRGLYMVDPSSANWMAVIGILVLNFVREFSLVIPESLVKLIRVARELEEVRQGEEPVHDYQSVIARLWNPQPMSLPRNREWSVRAMTVFQAEEEVSVTAFYGVVPREAFEQFYLSY